MTISLCLIGNSHLVALQDALRSAPDRWPTLTCRFVPFRRRTALECRVEAGVLVPDSPAARFQLGYYAGVETLPLRQFDAFAVVGLNLKLLFALALWKCARWSGLPSLAGVPDLAGLPHGLISPAAARAALAATLGDLVGPVVACRLAGAGLGPVLIVGQPALHRRAIWTDKGRFFGIGRAIEVGDAAAIAALHDAAAARAAASAGCRFLPQPVPTRHSDLLTRTVYMLGTLPAGSDRPAAIDHTHANAAYGALVLDQIAEALA